MPAEAPDLEGRRYDVVSSNAGGVGLEPAITKMVAGLRAERGGRTLTAEEFDELLGDLLRDAEP